MSAPGQKAGRQGAGWAEGRRAEARRLGCRADGRRDRGTEGRAAAGQQKAGLCTHGGGQKPAAIKTRRQPAASKKNTPLAIKRRPRRY